MNYSSSKAEAEKVVGLESGIDAAQAKEALHQERCANQGEAKVIGALGQCLEEVDMVKRADTQEN